jgi:hypothetical protein
MDIKYSIELDNNTVVGIEIRLCLRQEYPAAVTGM